MSLVSEGDGIGIQGILFGESDEVALANAKQTVKGLLDRAEGIGLVEEAKDIAGILSMLDKAHSSTYANYVRLAEFKLASLNYC